MLRQERSRLCSLIWSGNVAGHPPRRRQLLPVVLACRIGLAHARLLPLSIRGVSRATLFPAAVDARAPKPVTGGGMHVEVLQGGGSSRRQLRHVFSGPFIASAPKLSPNQWAIGSIWARKKPTPSGVSLYVEVLAGRGALRTWWRRVHDVDARSTRPAIARGARASMREREIHTDPTLRAKSAHVQGMGKRRRAAGLLDALAHVYDPHSDYMNKARRTILPSA